VTSCWGGDCEFASLFEISIEVQSDVAVFSIVQFDRCGGDLVRQVDTAKQSKRVILMSDVARDSNGNELKDGDNVTLIKDLKVKVANVTLKRGTMIKGIRLTDNLDEVDCRHEKVKGLVLRTEFLKKA
jgi:protein PhnA